MSIKIIYRPVKKFDNFGYLKIRIIENRKTRIKSLGIKIKGANWLEGKQQVSKAEANHEKINEKISETLKELAQHDTPQQVIQSSNRTILEFYDDIIKTTINPGTSSKYLDIKKRFEKYLNEAGLSDLKFSQLTTDHVQSFYMYMRNNNCAINTANYNMKSFKAIINKAIKSKVVAYYNSPFALLKLKFTKAKHKTLTTDEINRLFTTNFITIRKERFNSLGVELSEIASIFLFQTFAQGMRVSDVQLLKWSNFNVDNNIVLIDYTQFKTKMEVTLKLTQIACKTLLSRLIRFDGELVNRIESIERKRERYKENISNAQKLLDEAERQKKIIKITQLYNKEEGDEKEFVRSSWELTQRELVENNKMLLAKANNDIQLEYATLINELSRGERSNEFVFHFFSTDELFKNYKSGDELTPKQYARMQGTRAYYNILLKEVQRQADIKLNMSSHLARHTYTQLILESHADLVAVSKALGHSHISTTQTYISQLPNGKLLNINDDLSDSFNN